MLASSALPSYAAMQVDREVMGVAPAQCPELLLGPLDRDAHQFRECEAGAADALVQLRAEAAMRAAVLGDDLALGGVTPDEGLQPALRGAVTRVDEREGRLGLLDVGLDDRRDDVVFGLEVVVDVARRHVRGLRDVRQRCPFNALLVQELACGGDQPLPLPRPLLGGAFAGSFRMS